MKRGLKKTLLIIVFLLIATTAIVSRRLFKGGSGRDENKLKAEHEIFLKKYFTDLRLVEHRALEDPVAHGNIFYQIKRGIYVYQGGVRSIDNLMGKYKFCKYFGCASPPNMLAMVPCSSLFGSEVSELSNILNCEKKWYKLVLCFVDGYFYYAVMEFSTVGGRDDISGNEFLLESSTGFDKCYFFKSKLSYEVIAGGQAACVK
jgi:hypothetical protein